MEGAPGLSDLLLVSGISCVSWFAFLVGISSSRSREKPNRTCVGLEVRVSKPSETTKHTNHTKYHEKELASGFVQPYCTNIVVIERD